jgi:putative membrane protein
MNLYLIIKSLHLIAVISWMAGLLYLPRIFVYHVENYEKKEIVDIFEIMEKRLYNYIMRPAMLFSWIFGIILIYLNGLDVLFNIWIQIKLALVIILSGYHEYLGKCLTSLKNRTNIKTARFYRYINEVPTILLILIVFVVIIKPL